MTTVPEVLKWPEKRLLREKAYICSRIPRHLQMKRIHLKKSQWHYILILYCKLKYFFIFYFNSLEHAYFYNFSEHKLRNWLIWKEINTISRVDFLHSFDCLIDAYYKENNWHPGQYNLCQRKPHPKRCAAFRFEFEYFDSKIYHLYDYHKDKEKLEKQNYIIQGIHIGV